MAGDAWLGVHVLGDAAGVGREVATGEKVLLLPRVAYVACEPIGGEVTLWDVQWISDDACVLMYEGAGGRRGRGEEERERRGTESRSFMKG